MGDSSKRGHSPDMSGVHKEGKQYAHKDALETAKTPKCPLTPGRERRQDYTPKKTPYAGGNG